MESYLYSFYFFSLIILVTKIRVYAVLSLVVFPPTVIEVKETTVVNGLE